MLILSVKYLVDTFRRRKQLVESEHFHIDADRDLLVHHPELDLASEHHQRLQAFSTVALAFYPGSSWLVALGLGHSDRTR